MTLDASAHFCGRTAGFSLAPWTSGACELVLSGTIGNSIGIPRISIILTQPPFAAAFTARVSRKLRSGARRFALLITMCYAAGCITSRLLSDSPTVSFFCVQKAPHRGVRKKIAKVMTIQRNGSASRGTVPECKYDEFSAPARAIAPLAAGVCRSYVDDTLGPLGGVPQRTAFLSDRGHRKYCSCDA